MPRAALCVLALAVCLSACEGQPSTDDALLRVRAAGEEMEAAQTFAVQITFDLDTPDGYGDDVLTTVEGVVNLRERTAKMTATSSDGDGWLDIVVGDTAYNLRYPDASNPEWCATPTALFGDQVLAQAGTSFAEVPDLLRAAEGATVTAASSADQLTYQVFLPDEEQFDVDLLDDEIELQLDAEGRPTRVSYRLHLPFAGAPNPATADVLWTFQDWGKAEVDVAPPPSTLTDSFPDCTA